MAKFIANIECDIFSYDVKADISEIGVNVYEVLFGGEQLNHNQLIHFIKVYGEADLNDEVMSQYDLMVENERQDCLIEAFEIRQLEDGAA